MNHYMTVNGSNNKGVTKNWNQIIHYC